MAGIDSLLRMAVQSGADELRLATDEPPRMTQAGAPIKLSFPPTDGAMLGHLLEPLLVGGRAERLRAGEPVELAWTSGNDAFAVTLSSRDGGRVEAIFRRGAAKKEVSAPAPPSRPAVAPVAGTSAPAGAPPAALVALLGEAVACRASDVHLHSGEPPVVRVDGRLSPLDRPVADVEGLLAPLVGPTGADALAAGRSVDLAFEVPGCGRFRLSLYRAGDRLAAALRVLPKAAPRLAQLHFPVALDDLVDAPHGLVLVCGPTGSGKSATLAALADEALRRRPGVLVTLEDPIEYTLGRGGPGLVRQRQIGTDVRDFPTGLRDALRADPDLLLIGEMRDPETISLALTAAETGHLVFASLHSRSAASAVERIVDAYPPERQAQVRVQLADSLRAIVAQHLLPRARGAGRLPAVEILRATANVASLIREGKTAQVSTAIQSGRKEGMVPLERCLADLVRAGEIERKRALEVANDPTSLASYLQ